MPPSALPELLQCQEILGCPGPSLLLACTPTCGLALVAFWRWLFSTLRSLVKGSFQGMCSAGAEGVGRGAHLLAAAQGASWSWWVQRVEQLDMGIGWGQFVKPNFVSSFFGFAAVFEAVHTNRRCLAQHANCCYLGGIFQT